MKLIYRKAIYYRFELCFLTEITISSLIDNALCFLLCSRQLLNSTLTPVGIHLLAPIKKTD
ncbi:unnamed protein product [Musa acuminata subsp. malaccensis]|uniref:(wild Malaysian banana) hypothetical protein n=1 Tax=Musa acuminata subsp. malaccensis TaxID=214687 RepID=A0A8D6ZXB1_MUSAM|nr:unnamed protein product [Musa acuminata subsp. malaccensis]